MFDYEKSKIITERFVQNPRVGDWFHEMFSYWLYVTEVTSRHVTFREREGNELSAPKTITRKAFVKKLSYGSIPGCWVDWDRNETLEDYCKRKANKEAQIAPLSGGAMPQSLA